MGREGRRFLTSLSVNFGMKPGEANRPKRMSHAACEACLECHQVTKPAQQNVRGEEDQE